jgi:hypothetical protein
VALTRVFCTNQGTASQASEKLARSLCFERHGFIRAAQCRKLGWALKAAEKLAIAGVLKGHEFIRAVKSLRMTTALAAGGWGRALECR